MLQRTIGEACRLQQWEHKLISHTCVAFHVMFILECWTFIHASMPSFLSGLFIIHLIDQNGKLCIARWRRLQEGYTGHLLAAWYSKLMRWSRWWKPLMSSGTRCHSPSLVWRVQYHWKVNWQYFWSSHSVLILRTVRQFLANFQFHFLMFFQCWSCR